MELHHLATFRSLATTLNFTQTAALLGYVQSSVSAQIQELEAELDALLFDRLNVIIETMDATAAQTLTFNVTSDLYTKEVHVWTTK